MRPTPAPVLSAIVPTLVLALALGGSCLAARAEGGLSVQTSPSSGAAAVSPVETLVRSGLSLGDSDVTPPADSRLTVSASKPLVRVVEHLASGPEGTACDGGAPKDERFDEGALGTCVARALALRDELDRRGFPQAPVVWVVVHGSTPIAAVRVEPSDQPDPTLPAAKALEGVAAWWASVPPRADEPLLPSPYRQPPSQATSEPQGPGDAPVPIAPETSEAWLPEDPDTGQESYQDEWVPLWADDTLPWVEDVPAWTDDAPSWVEDVPAWTDDAPSWSEDAPVWVEDSPAWTENVWVVDSAAWDEPVYVLVRPAWDEDVLVETAPGGWRTVGRAAALCNDCGLVFTTDEIWDHILDEFALGGKGSFTDTVVYEDVWFEPEYGYATVTHPEEGYWSSVHHDETGHWETLPHEATGHWE